VIRSVATPYAVPAGRRVAGAVAAPPSKSVTQRYFNLALLARCPLRVERPLVAADTRLFLVALERCGFAVAASPEAVRLAPGPPPDGGEIDCGDGGTMLRLLTASLATQPGRWRLDGSPRLRQRPVGPLVAALRALGAEIRCLGAGGCAPLEIRGGRLAGGAVRLDAGESSQYLSALLMAALAASGPVEVEVTALTSAPYVDLTREAAAAFGGRIDAAGAGRWRVVPGLLPPPALAVEGDYSAACYWAAAAALTGGRVKLRRLSPDSAQGDRRFLDLLVRMGARVEVRDDGWEVAGGGTLTGLTADLGALPDQVPTLAALAPFARGATRIEGVPHLRLKESDRLAALAAELGRAGAQVEERPDGLTIAGSWAAGPPPSEPLVVDPHGDHRIAMSLALVGLRRPGLAVSHPGVVAKSYPDFWRDLESLLA
jgi:3-phosphoshikimate 1-carboxyvinyltransferase